MKYRFTALRGDKVAASGEFSAISIDRTIVLRIPEQPALTDAEVATMYQAAQTAFPDRFVLLISQNIEFLCLEPVEDKDD